MACPVQPWHFWERDAHVDSHPSLIWRRPLYFHSHALYERTHVHQHLLATWHVGVRLRDSGEGQRTGAVSTFHQGDTVTHTHTHWFLPLSPLRSALLYLKHFLSLCNKMFTRTLTVKSDRLMPEIAFPFYSDLCVAHHCLRTSSFPTARRAIWTDTAHSSKKLVGLVVIHVHFLSFLFAWFFLPTLAFVSDS